MTVCVYIKGKGESIYKNVKHINTGAEMINGKPVYSFALMQANHMEEFKVEDVSSFEVFNELPVWIEDTTDIVCPHCGQYYNDDILNMAHGERVMYHCPKCGKPVDLDSFYNDTIEGV